MSPLLLLVAVVLGCGSGGLIREEADPKIVEQVLIISHSNGQGHNVDANGANGPPAGIPTQRVDLFRRCLVANETFSDSALQTLQVTPYGGPAGTSHGIELGIGNALLGGIGATRRCAILKVTANSSQFTDWIGGGTHNASLQTAISDFSAAVAAKFPFSPRRWHVVVLLGAWEGSSNEPDNTKALAIPTNGATLVSNIRTYTGQTEATLNFVQEGDSISTQPWLSTETASLSTLASNTGGTLQNIDSYDAYQSDGRHYTATVLNSIGTQVGNTIVSYIISH